MGWQQDLLAAVGAPATDVNVEALTLWAASEGTPAEWNNPLATTEPGFGGHQVNEAGVQGYPDESAGVQALAATLTNGRYGPVLEALRTDAALAAIYTAVNQSPWCAGCQGGHYPVALWEQVNATQADPTHVPGPPEFQITLTDAAAHPSGGVYVLAADGGVFTFHGAPFFGSYPGLPEADRQGQRTAFVKITVAPDGSGYTLTDESGEAYHFTAATVAPPAG